MKKTQILLLDAIREDYINKELMPFLYTLKKKHTYLSMIPSIGYSNGAHSTIWSGLHQDKHENFLMYCKTNESYFKYIGNVLKLIPSYWMRIFLISFLKIPYYKISYLRKNPPGWYHKIIINYPPGLPPSIARFFKVYDKPAKHYITLFSILNKKKITWMTQTDMKNPYFIKSKPKDLSKFVRTDNKIDFYYFYFGDGLGHEKGVFSKELIDYLRKMDNKIRQLVDKNDNFFIFSDHGMIEITSFIDIKKYLTPLFKRYKLGKDFIFFLDTTMVRFWVLNKNIEKYLLKVIKNIPHTTFMTKDLLNRYGINFEDNKWFDYMILLDPGYRTFPDFFAPVKWAFKAAHGYWPEHLDSKGIFITNTFKTNKKEINIVDIMPTILKAIGLEKAIPKDIDGKPIF